MGTLNLSGLRSMSNVNTRRQVNKLDMIDASNLDELIQSSNKDNIELLPLICDEYQEVGDLRILIYDKQMSIVDEQFKPIMTRKISEYSSLEILGNNIVIVEQSVTTLVYTAKGLKSDNRINRIVCAGLEIFHKDIIIAHHAYAKNSLVSHNSWSLTNIGFSYEQLIYHEKKLLPPIYSDIRLNNSNDKRLTLWLKPFNGEGFTATLNLETMKLDRYGIKSTENDLVNGIAQSFDESTGELLYAVQVGYNIVTEPIYNSINTYKELDKFNLIEVGISNRNFSFDGTIMNVIGYIDYAGNEVVPAMFNMCSYTGYKKFFITGKNNPVLKFGVYDAESGKELIDNCDSFSIHPSLNFSYLMKNNKCYILGNDGIYDDMKLAFKELYRYKLVQGIFVLNVYNRWYIIDNNYTVIRLELSKEEAENKSNWELVVW